MPENIGIDIHNSSVTIGQTYAAKRRGWQIRAQRYDLTGLRFTINAYINGEKCKIINISEAGICIETKAIIEIKELVSLKIDTNLEHIIYDSEAFVLWVVKTANFCKIGLIFIPDAFPQGFIEGIIGVALVAERIFLRNEDLNLVPKEVQYIISSFEEYLNVIFTEIKQHEERLKFAAYDFKLSLKKAIKIFLIDEIALSTKLFVKNLNKSLELCKDENIREKSLHYAKRKLLHFYEQSPFVLRAVNRPRGVNFDYEMYAQIWRKGEIESPLIGVIMQKVFMSIAGTYKIEKRLDYISNKLQNIIVNSNNIATLGPSSCLDFMRFVENLPSELLFTTKMAFIEQDVEAILHIKTKNSMFLYANTIRPDIRFIQAGTRDFLDNTSALKGIEDLLFNIWYISGFFDWLSNSVLELMLQEIKKKSAPNAMIIVKYLSPDNTLLQLGEILFDWKIIKRDVHDLEMIFSKYFVNIEIDSQSFASEEEIWLIAYNL